MAFSNLELELIDNKVGGLCRKLNHPEYKDELSIEYKVHRHDVVIYEKRPAYNKPGEKIETPSVKLKYFRTKNEWGLYWMRKDMKWHIYKPFSNSVSLGDLLAEVKADPYGCFFG